MDIDYIRGIDSFVETVNTSTLVIDECFYVISSNKAAVAEKLSFQEIVLDMETHRVTRSGENIKLGPTEFRLLATFFRKAGEGMV